MHPPTSPTSDWQPEFLRLLNNRPLPNGQKERTSGFVAIAGGTSLAPVESVCAGQRYNYCVTVRYRVRGPAAVGSVLDRLAEDLGRVSAAEAPVGTITWPERIDPAGFARRARDAGVVRRAPLDTAAATVLVGGFAKVLEIGYRLVILAELEEPPDRDEWRLACATLFRSLPERVGFVFACDRPGLWVPRGTQFAELLGALEPTEPGVAGLDNDRPQTEDTLGIDPHHLALAKFLLHERTDPLTLAVEAPWGRGKSSFMTFLEGDLVALAREQSPAAANEVIVLHFNAWRYRHAEQLWAGLAHQVFHDLRRRLPWRSRVVLPFRYGWRHRGRDLVTLVALLVLALALALAASLVAGSGDGDVTGGVLGVGSVLALAALVMRSAKLARPAVDWLASYARMPDYANARGRQHEVIDDLRFISDAVRRSQPGCRIVLVVDDLDRCSDAHIVELLSAVHIVLGASDFYVILGVDTRMVYRAIAKETSMPAGEVPGEQEDIPGDYLRKIVQVSYRLPRLGPTERFRLVKSMYSEKSQQAFEQLEHARAAGEDPAAGDREPPRRGPAAETDAAEPTVHAFAVEPAIVVAPSTEPPNPLEDTPVELEAYRDFAPLLPENPRQIKRLVNAHRMVKQMFVKRSAYWQRADQRTLVLWLCACMRWPAPLATALDPAARTADLREWADSGGDLLEWLTRTASLPARDQQELADLPREPDDRLRDLDAHTRGLREKLIRCGLLEDQLPSFGTVAVTRRTLAPVGDGGVEVG